MSPSRSAVVLSPRRVGTVMAAAVVGLTVVYGAVVFVNHQYGAEAFYRFGVLFRVFDMDAEMNVPAWYSVVALAGSATLAALVAAAAPREGGRRHWAGLAVVVLYLSLDDLAVLHEELSVPTVDLLGLDRGEWGHWAWVFPVLALVAVFAAVYTPFLRRLPAGTRRGLLAAGAVYVAGAAGMELVGRTLWEDGDTITLGYRAVVGMEEVLEMAAVVVLAVALLRHLRDHVGPVTVSFHVDRPTVAVDRPTPEVPTGGARPTVAAEVGAGASRG